MQKPIFSLMFVVLFAGVAMPIQAAEFDVYIGTYTRGDAKGIYHSRFDTATGKLSEPQLAAECRNPSFLAVHPAGDAVYAANEVSPGTVTAYQRDPATGQLTKLNDISSEGNGPCHLVVDKAGNYVLVANYGSGSVASLALGPDRAFTHRVSHVVHQGSSVNPKRQKEPHAHSINLEPKHNEFAVAADLGMDKVLVYGFDKKTGELGPSKLPHVTVAPGSGPRHTAFHPTKPYYYVLNELLATVTAFEIGDNKWTELQTLSTQPAEPVPGNSTAEIQVHPTGKFVYGSNRGHNSIVVFAVDQETGKLTHVEHESTQGKTPRNFCIDPTGTHLLAANEHGDNVVVFKIDQQSGALTPTGQQVKVVLPVCIKFVPRS